MSASTPAPRLSGAPLFAAISKSIVAILRERYGRGPMTAKTYALDDLIVVVTRNGGFTPLEQTTLDSGNPAQVVKMRRDFERDMAKLYTTTIERLTGRTVLAFISQVHVDPEITMETFYLDAPVDVPAAVEIFAPR